MDGSVRRIIAVPSGLLAAAVDGVYRSLDGGASWQILGLNGLTVWDVAAAPQDPDTLYAGVQPAAFYRSGDGGRAWQEIESIRSVPGSEIWLYPIGNQGPRARTIALDPADPHRIWLGVEVGGNLISEDGGAHWECVTLDGNPDIHVLIRHPADRNVLLATAGYGRIDRTEPPAARRSGFYRSEDGGRTWQRRWDDAFPRYAVALAVDPRPPFAVTVAAAPTPFSQHSDQGGAQSRLFRSDDEGSTWHPLGDSDHSPSAANLTALCPDRGQPGGVLVGTDTGEVWQVGPRAEWRRLVAGPPPVQSILQL